MNLEAVRASCCSVVLTIVMVLVMAVMTLIGVMIAIRRVMFASGRRSQLHRSLILLPLLLPLLLLRHLPA